MAISTRAVLGLSIGLCSLTAVLAAGRERISGAFIETKDVTPDEMAELTRLAAPSGKQPWLVYGFRYSLGAPSAVRHTSFDVYLQPDAVNGALRRGRKLRVEELAPSAGGPQPEWRIDYTANYAQVADSAGLPDTPIGRWNRLRPFDVGGEFDDRTLLNLVELIRSNAPAPNFGKGEAPDRVNGSLAMSHVRRTGDGIEVRLIDPNGFQGESVTLKERDGGLVVVKVGLWIT